MAKRRGQQAVRDSAVVSGLSPSRLLFSLALSPAVQAKARLERLRGHAQQHALPARLG